MELYNIMSSFDVPTTLWRLSWAWSALLCWRLVTFASSWDDTRSPGMLGFNDAKIRFRCPSRVMSSNYKAQHLEHRTCLPHYLLTYTSRTTHSRSISNWWLSDLQETQLLSVQLWYFSIFSELCINYIKHTFGITPQTQQQQPFNDLLSKTTEVSRHQNSHKH